VSSSLGISDRVLSSFGERPRTSVVVLVAAAAFAAITAGRFAIDNPTEGIGYLYVLPIALVGVQLGWRSGVCAGAAASLLVVAWAQARDVDISALGYGVRTAVFVGMGFVTGVLVDQRARIEQEAARWFLLSTDLLCIADRNGHFVRLNPAWTALLGYDADELRSRPFIDFVHPEDVERTTAVWTDLAAPASVVDFENRYRARDGSWHWLLWSASSDGGRVYAAAKDITERKRLEQEREQLIEELAQTARTDELTGLPNRRGFNERLIDEIRRAARFDLPLSVALLDLDGFKAVNDKLGHAAGDRLLREVAAAWRDALRDTDYLGRIGGDEFAVVLPGCRRQDHAAVLDRLHAAMPAGHHASVGVATWDGEEPLRRLFKRADEALYEAKAARSTTRR
jgi:diguanylate cyclase (GGDEF)-like protein/PAS domain S-box-containing protein